MKIVELLHQLVPHFHHEEYPAVEVRHLLLPTAELSAYGPHNSAQHFVSIPIPTTKGSLSQKLFGQKDGAQGFDASAPETKMRRSHESSLSWWPEWRPFLDKEVVEVEHTGAIIQRPMNIQMK